ncbi:replication initiator protein A [Enterococcus casseliflavus]|uniref:replication initiator protein A n=1 Tax=Enterococcus casseliflavus TaxID=37734 RepID=UPI0034D35502
MSQKLNISLYQQGNFYRVPKLLIQGKKYEGLSSDAKLLYAVYQDRAELSIQNKWMDSNGDIYFLYSIDEVCFFMGWGKDKVIKVKKELINYSLLAEKRQGRNLVNKTYLFLIDVNTEERKFISKTRLLSEIDKWLNILNRQLLGSTDKEIQNNCLDHLITEFSCCEKAVKNFLTSYKISISKLIAEKKEYLSIKEVGKSDFQKQPDTLGKSENQISGLLKKRILEVGKTDPNDTDKNDNYMKKKEEEHLKEEISRLVKTTPMLSFYIQRLILDKKVSLEIEYLVVNGLDSCWQLLLFERDHFNQRIIQHQRLYGEHALVHLFHEMFEKQLEYTQRNCLNPNYFHAYFIKGMKDRLESQLF